MEGRLPWQVAHSPRGGSRTAGPPAGLDRREIRGNPEVDINRWVGVCCARCECCFAGTLIVLVAMQAARKSM